MCFLLYLSEVITIKCINGGCGHRSRYPSHATAFHRLSQNKPKVSPHEPITFLPGAYFWPITFLSGAYFWPITFLSCVHKTRLVRSKPQRETRLAHVGSIGGDAVDRWEPHWCICCKPTDVSVRRHRTADGAHSSLVVWVEFTYLARRGFEEQLHNNSCFYRERGGHIETKREEWQIKKWDVGGVNTRPVFSS